ncbi:MAG: ATP phosphoribosyltransferase regulatory subunit [Zoogloeaceae bacterium]|jgi:ATP phosphoribosyltransferase regulatory subunit|nr:ATP phosphoribosyltransferase regulatory subunit [Zoogloeaceae bacterium]
MNWLLPEHLADALPAEASRIEALRRQMLDGFARHGFELVTPPLMEYLESLLTGAGRDLSLRTCKLADAFSGRTLGVRADMTPQVARIDAHLLNRKGVTRLCYCGSVLHARPASLLSSREPLQIGAELYGYAGVEADIEILRLLVEVLQRAALPECRVDLGHVGLFRALFCAAQIDMAAEETLFGLLQNKDVPALAAFCAGLPKAGAPFGAALMALPQLYGAPETVLAKARALLPALPDIDAALETLARLAKAVPDFPVSIDLADLRGYHYHSGAVFAAYAPGHPTAVALGGRYDGVGKSFGRARPATGFSLDLRELVRLLPPIAAQAVIFAPYSGDDPELAAEIARLRDAGERVAERLPDEDATPPQDAGRQLVRQKDGWRIATRTIKD